MELAGNALRAFRTPPKFDGSPPDAPVLDVRLGAESVFAREPTPDNPFSFSIDTHTLYCALDRSVCSFLLFAQLCLFFCSFLLVAPHSLSRSMTLWNSALTGWSAALRDAIDEERDVRDEADDDVEADARDALAAIPPATPGTATRRYSRALSLRMDGAVGPFTRDEFVTTYGGTDEWDDAAELRIDADGGRFSKQEFVAHYGGADEWDAAERIDWLASRRI